jgi:catalase
MIRPRRGQTIALSYALGGLIVRTTTVEEIGDPVMLHDPTRLTDGIEASDDPILAVRRGVYEISVAHRTGGWKGRLAALERAGSPFA